MKIILANGTEIQVTQATYDGHYVINYPNKQAYQTDWDLMESANLADFKLYDGDNLINRTLNTRLSSTQAIINPDNTVTGHFYFTGGTIVLNEYEQAGKILLGEEESE